MTRRRLDAAWLALRSLFWTVLLPGMLAGYIPYRWLGLARLDLDPGDPLQLAGLLCAAAGAAVAVTCIVEFARSGGGTLSPADPPDTLVVRGLYRYVRNPMYVGVALVLAGEWLLLRSLPMLVYAAAWFLAVNLFIRGYEEPYLRRRFGASYEQYVRDVGRWLPRGRPAAGTEPRA